MKRFHSFRSCCPAIATLVPMAAELGVKELIVGAAVTVKLTPLLSTPLALTTTFPVVAPAGTVVPMPVVVPRACYRCRPVEFHGARTLTRAEICSPLWSPVRQPHQRKPRDLLCLSRHDSEIRSSAGHASSRCDDHVARRCPGWRSRRNT